MPTNGSINIYKRTKSYKGEITNTLVGSYDIWVNEEEQFIYRNVGGATTLVKTGKGIIFLFEEVDLKNCFLKYLTKVYEIISINTYRKSATEFGHTEIIYE